MPGAGSPVKAQALDKAVLDWIQNYQKDAEHPWRPSRSAILGEAARMWTRAGLRPPKEKWLKGFLNDQVSRDPGFHLFLFLALSHASA